MKYLIAIIIALSAGAYFLYDSVTEHYKYRVSGDVFIIDGQPQFSRDENFSSAFLQKGTEKIGMEVLWDTWPAIAAGGILGVGTFALLFFTFAPGLINSDLTGKIEKLESRVKHEMERAEEAENLARAELKHEYQKVAEKAQSAETLWNNALKLEAESKQAIAKAQSDIAESHKMRNQAVKFAKQQRSAKDNASSGMHRHRLKVKKLREDKNELIKFIKQYHADLLQRQS